MALRFRRLPLMMRGLQGALRMWWLPGLFIVGYLLLCLFLFLRQDEIIFHPAGPNTAVRDWIEQRWPGSRGVISLEGGQRIETFRLFHDPGAPLLIYFGGNALDVAEMAPHLARLSPFNVVLWNYPGYGMSSGRPSEKAILKAALAVYDHFAREKGGDGGSILLVGRSLGSAVATYVANRRRCRGLVLITPFDSLISLGRWRYPYIPVGPRLRHRFTARRWLAGVEVPILVILAERDETVPHRFAQALVNGHRGVRQIVIPGVDHGSIGEEPAVYDAISRFWEELP